MTTSGEARAEACEAHDFHLMTMAAVYGGLPLPIEQLDPMFRQPIKRFADEHPELGTPQGAAMMCTRAAFAFRERQPNTRIESIDLGEMQHDVIAYGALLVDFTARQVWPCADYPLVVIRS